MLSFRSSTRSGAPSRSIRPAAPRLLGLFGACLLLFPAMPVQAQGAIHEQIAAIDRQLEAEPRNGDLWTKRGRLHLESGRLDDAARDLERALDVDPAQRSALYFLSRARLAMGDLPAAESSVDRFLEMLEADDRGGRFRGLLQKGDVLVAREKPAAAAAVYEQALGLADRPRPAHYLATVDALILAGNRDRALAILAEARSRLGAVPSLEVREVGLLIELGRQRQAVALLDRLAAASPMPARWRVDQGDLLASIGDQNGARRAYEAALRALEDLPAARAGMPAMAAMAERARAGLRALDESSQGDGSEKASPHSR